ncbi:GNAT family N-acetyltransferase [Parvibaculum sp.]|uniref:GNAT family N-acetyltransferase n=1 Tax=Parvibaculum sp. TaxID=2024848 RepID=UPI002C4D5C73|nr:GNAT family N-acetyltransferase [Parvibaculum sp.]HUD52798.1 GNAT family N-acetyltransferase [Parvibaculum sp.]
MTVLTRYQVRMAWPDQDEDLIARLKIICWREAYPGILPQPILDDLNLGRSIVEWTHALQTGIAWIAEQSGGLVGFGHARDNEVTTLYVRKMDQGRGVGRELLQHCFDEIACLGHDEAHLWVLEKNIKAQRFYERMGGVATARRPVGFSRYPWIAEVRYDFRLPS